MRISLIHVLALLVCTILIARPVSAGPILMPAGSTVWMKFEAAVAPDVDGDDVAGSNQPGPSPPNGIPLTTVSDGTVTATGFAEVFPDRVRTFISSRQFASMHASFEDTYTVEGTAAGEFPITVTLTVSGTARSVQNGPFHQLIGANIEAEIGNFNHDPNVLLEQHRVEPFDATTAEILSIPSKGSAFEGTFEVVATHTRVVSVGDVFSIGYGVNTAFSIGELDLRDTATIAFTLPDGVTLSSVLVPEPSTSALAIIAVACVGGVAASRRRSRKS